MKIINVLVNLVHPDWELAMAITGIILVMVYGYYTRKSDLSGTLSGGIIALILFINIQWAGIVLFLLFFILGSVVSKWQFRSKVIDGLAQSSEGRRTAVHAFSNAGAAAVYSCLVWISIPDTAMIMVAGVFAAALSDTFSSEIGNVTGSGYYNILTLKKDVKGKDGVISAEGSVAGLGGSILIAAAYYVFYPVMASATIIALAGMLSNLLDSLLGATLQRKNIINNHQVNLIATSAGGMVCGVVYWVLNY